jgi:hypothetical protein
MSLTLVYIWSSHAFQKEFSSPKVIRRDAFNGMIEDLNTTQRAVSSTHKLVAAITDRCIGTFARHQPGLQEDSFPEMIDMAIGTLVSSSMPAGCGQDFLTYATTRLVGKLASSSASNGTQLWSPTK